MGRDGTVNAAVRPQELIKAPHGGLATMVANAMWDPTMNRTVDIASMNIDALLKWPSPIYVYHSTLLSVGKTTIESNVFQCLKMILSEMIEIQDVELRDRLVMLDIIPAGGVEENVYRDAAITKCVERTYTNHNTQASLIIPGAIRELHQNSYGDLLHIDSSALGKNPTNIQEMNRQYRTVSEHFLQSAVRMLSNQSAYAVHSHQLGTKKRLLEIIGSRCIHSPLLRAMTVYAKDINYHSALELSLHNVNTDVHMDEQNRMRFQALLEERIAGDTRDVYLLARDPSLFIARITETAKMMGNPLSISSNEEPEDSRNTAKLFAAGGLEHDIHGYIFMTSNCINLLKQRVPVYKGKLKHEAPAELLPSEAITDMPDMSVLKILELNKQKKNPASGVPNDVQADAAMSKETPTETEVAGLVMKLTKFGAHVLKNSRNLENPDEKPAPDTQNKLGYWDIERDVEYILNGENEAYPIEAVDFNDIDPKTDSLRTSPVTSRRRVITNVHQNGFRNSEVMMATWLSSVLTSKPVNYIARDEFQMPDVITYIPGLAPQQVVFDMKQLAYAVSRLDLHSPHDNTNALNETLAEARRNGSNASDQAKSIANGLLQMLAVAKDRNEYYKEYYRNTTKFNIASTHSGSGNGSDNACAISGMNSGTGNTNGAGSNILRDLESIECSANYIRTARKMQTPTGTQIIDPNSGEAMMEFGFRMNRIVHEYPMYNTDPTLNTLRGVQMLTHTMSEDEIRTLNSMLTKAHNYLTGMRKENGGYYFDATQNEPFHPRLKDNDTTTGNRRDVSIAEYLSAVHYIVEQLKMMYISIYSQLDDDDEIRRMNFLLDTDNENKAKWRIFVMCLLPVLVYGSMRVIVNHNDKYRNILDDDIPCGAYISASKQDPMDSFLLVEGSLDQDEITDLCGKHGFQGEDHHDQEIVDQEYPISVVGSGNIHQLCIPGKPVLLRLCTIFMNYEYTKAFPLTKMCQNRVPLPFVVDWYSTRNIASDNALLVTPSSTTCVIGGNKLSSNCKNVEKDIKVHMTTQMKTASNALVATGVLMETVSFNPALTINTTNSDKTPTINMDYYKQTAAGSAVFALTRAKAEGHISDEDYEVMCKHHTQLEKSQYGALSVSRDKNKLFTDYTYMIRPATKFKLSSHPKPIIGISPYLAKRPGSNPYAEFYFMCDPLLSDNPWASNFGSHYMSIFTPNRTKMCQDFSVITACKTHGRVIVSPTVAAIQYLYQLQESSGVAGLRPGERLTVANYVLQMKATEPEVTVNGVSFLNPTTEPQLGAHDYTTNMGYCTPDSQFTKRELYESVERPMTRAKYANEPGNIYADPYNVPLYEGGGDVHYPLDAGHGGPYSYYVRGCFSSNRLVNR